MPISTTAKARSPRMSAVSVPRMITAIPTRITPTQRRAWAGATQPARSNRSRLHRDQQPARQVQEDSQPTDETKQGEGNPDCPDGHTELEGQAGRHAGQPAALFGPVK